MTNGRKNPQSLGYIVNACDEWEHATRARGVESREISLALQAVEAVRIHLKVLCVALNGDCDPPSDQICAGPPHADDKR